MEFEGVESGHVAGGMYCVGVGAVRVNAVGDAEAVQPAVALDGGGALSADGDAGDLGFRA